MNHRIAQTNPWLQRPGRSVCPGGGLVTGRVGQGRAFRLKTRTQTVVIDSAPEDVVCGWRDFVASLGGQPVALTVRVGTAKPSQTRARGEHDGSGRTYQ